MTVIFLNKVIFESILNKIKVMVNAVSEFILNSSGIGLFMLISEDVPS